MLPAATHIVLDLATLYVVTIYQRLQEKFWKKATKLG